MYKRKNYEAYLKKYPWFNSYNNARSRCVYEYGAYFKKGIKFLLTKVDMQFLWDRDKASLMKKASIDRLDNKKDYTIDNCRFIELRENQRLGAMYGHYGI